MNLANVSVRDSQTHCTIRSEIRRGGSHRFFCDKSSTRLTHMWNISSDCQNRVYRRQLGSEDKCLVAGCSIACALAPALDTSRLGFVYLDCLVRYRWCRDRGAIVKALESYSWHQVSSHSRMSLLKISWQPWGISKECPQGFQLERRTSQESLPIDWILARQWSLPDSNGSVLMFLFGDGQLGQKREAHPNNSLSLRS